MFAVLKTGGKQYKVEKGQVLKIEKIDASEGSIVVFDDVLLSGDGKSVSVGEPNVKDIKVSAEVLEQGRAAKITVFKKKRRHNYRRKKGHKQEQTVIRIQDIGKSLTAKPAPAKKAAKPAVKKADADTSSKAKKAAPSKKAATKPAAKKAPAKKTGASKSSATSKNKTAANKKKTAPAKKKSTTTKK